MDNQNKDEVAERDNNKEPLLLPFGWRLYLQLAGSNKKWLDWIYLAKSDFAYASIGVFAAKNFQKGGIIGFYIGEETWKAPSPGTEAPNKEYMKSHKIEEDVYCFLTRNKDATMRQVYPKPFNDRSTQLLYMGMHYLNNACTQYDINSNAFQKARKLNNCQYLDDGIIITEARLNPGDELLSGYNPGEQKQMTKCRNYPYHPKKRNTTNTDGTHLGTKKQKTN
jgi:hypothetical protein